MGDTTSRVRGFAGRSVGFVRSRPRSQQLVGGGLALALVTAPFGGWEDAVDPAAVVSMEVGTPFRVGPFELTVEKAVSLPDLAPTYTPEDGNKVLAVVVQIENIHNRPENVSTTLRDALHVGPGSGVVLTGSTPEPLVAKDYDDTSSISDINPGITHKAVLLWQQDGDWSGDSVMLTFDELTWKEEDDLLQIRDHYWSDLDEPGLAIRIPVEVKP